MDVTSILAIAAGVLGLVVVFRLLAKKKPVEDEATTIVVTPPRDPMKKPGQAAAIKRKPVRSKNGRTYRYDHTGRDGRDYYRDDRGGDVVDFLILWWVLDSMSQDAYMADNSDFTPDESYQAEAAQYDVADEAPVGNESADSADDTDSSSSGDVTPSTSSPADDDTLRSAPAPAPEPTPSSCGSSDSGDSGGSSCGSSCGGD